MIRVFSYVYLWELPPLDISDRSGPARCPCSATSFPWPTPATPGSFRIRSSGRLPVNPLTPVRVGAADVVLAVLGPKAMYFLLAALVDRLAPSTPAYPAAPFRGPVLRTWSPSHSTDKAPPWN